MSFSFNVKGRTCAEALVKVRDQLGVVVEQQPVHEKDVGAVLGTAERYASLAGEPPVGSVLNIFVAASIGLIDGKFSTASVNVSVGFVAEAAD